MEAGHARDDVDLDLDEVRVAPDERDGFDLGEHGRCDPGPGSATSLA